MGDCLNARVDREFRMAVCRNHTPPTPPQAALREVLGDHVHQAGSYQSEELTHFDFTHFSAVTPEELALRGTAGERGRLFEAMPVCVR